MDHAAGTLHERLTVQPVLTVGGSDQTQQPPDRSKNAGLDRLTKCAWPGLRCGLHRTLEARWVWS
jgi:hypothetical protein